MKTPDMKRAAAMRRTAAAVLGVAVGALGALPPSRLAAQELDRTRVPASGTPRPVTAPAIVKRTLPNGLEVWTVTQRELPAINAVLLIRAGAVDDGTRPGLAQVTAALLDEGTDRRSSLDFARAVDALGANLGAAAGDEATQVSLQTLTKTADSAFALMGELVLRPAFKAEELERERKSRLQALRQQKDQPTIIATQVFSQLVYGEAHPYGHAANGTLESIGALTPDDITGFYRSYYRPNNAVLIVFGDVTPARASALATHAFGNWMRGVVPKAAAAVPARPAARPTAIYLVDKPGAAQSEIRIGHPGLARTSPDYYAAQVLNTALGGQFASRINLNLREAKGYTYGARSGWRFARGDGPFTASGGVFTGKTDSSLVEFFRELRDVRGGRPLSPAEVEFAKGSLVRGYPRSLETSGGIANVLAELALFRLPGSEISRYLTKTEAVTAAEVGRVARQYLAPDSAVVVVVGDLARIRPGIEALGLGPVTVLDTDGKPLAAR
jgi:zinc protease